MTTTRQRTTTPAGGSPTAQSFVWDARSAQASLLMDSGSAYVYASGAAPLMQVGLPTGTIEYLIPDRLGSIRGVVSATGTLVASTSFDAWGNTLSSTSLSPYTSFGFAGMYVNATGLGYLLSRYYQPSTGQFLSLDPSVAQTDQPYSYASDDPVNLTDPTGNYSYGDYWLLYHTANWELPWAYWAFISFVHQIFPFNTGDCAAFYVGEHCDFHPFCLWGYCQDDFLHVSEMHFTPGYIGFVVLTVDHWCLVPSIFGACAAGIPKGSTITFALLELNQQPPGLILAQFGNAPGAGFLVDSTVPRISLFIWYHQAVNISKWIGAGGDVAYITNLSYGDTH